MEKIIKKAMQVGGWSPNEWDERVYNDSGEVRTCLLDPLFWQALEKSRKPYEDSFGMGDWKKLALKFHEINLTQGWDKAVEWLEDLIK